MGIIVAFLICGMADNYNLLQKVFLAVTAYLIRWIAAGIVLDSWHGYGMRNVKKVAEKYFGTVEIQPEDGEIRTTVMIVLPM